MLGLRPPTTMEKLDSSQGCFDPFSHIFMQESRLERRSTRGTSQRRLSDIKIRENQFREKKPRIFRDLLNAMVLTVEGGGWATRALLFVQAWLTLGLKQTANYGLECAVLHGKVLHLPTECLTS